MTWNIDEVLTGMALGGVAGIALGYEIRKLVERFQRFRDDHRKGIERINKRDIRKAYKHDTVVAIKKAPEAKPAHIPISRPASRERQPIPVINDRDDVIAALVGAGYKKQAAVDAVDACTLPERAAGVEHWTVAALRRAGAK